MEIQKRIEKIGSIFKGFNISNGIAYITLVFPSNWKLPDADALLETFKVKMANDGDGVYFFTEIENGTDVLFDAAEHVIAFNEEIEERINLFNQKIAELKELFSKETIDNLKKITITIGGSKRKVKNKAKTTAPEPPVDTNEENNEQSSIMSLAEKIVEE